MRVAHLHRGTFFVRERGGELWNCFQLRLTTPEGDEIWDGGWGCFGDLAWWQGKGLEAFEVQMQSSFDDHMRDLAERGLTPDRGYEELPVDVDLTAALRNFIDPELRRPAP